MISFLADENFHAGILRGFLRRMPQADVIRVQDAGLVGASDEEILEWCGIHNRILLTHDVSTIVPLAWKRVDAHHNMPGVVEIPALLSYVLAIDDLVLLAGCGQADDFKNNVVFLPIR